METNPQSHREKTRNQPREVLLGRLVGAKIWEQTTEDTQKRPILKYKLSDGHLTATDAT